MSEVLPNKSIGGVRLEGPKTYPTGVARAGATTEAKRASVAKTRRGACILYHRLNLTEAVSDCANGIEWVVERLTERIRTANEFSQHK